MGTSLISTDTDNDGLTDYEEYGMGTNPKSKDSDGDKMTDYDEYQAGTDPTDRTKFPAKINLNMSFAKGVTTDKEYIYVLVDQVDPADPEGPIIQIGEFPMSIVRNKATGSIALPTGYEYIIDPVVGVMGDDGNMSSVDLYGDYKNINLKKSQTLSFVLDGDSDGDGVIDSVEARLKSSSSSDDTDGDGLTDYEEYGMGTSLISTDTDNDGYNDYLEHLLGTNPTSKNDKPVIFTEYSISDSSSDPLSIYYLDKNGNYIAEELTISDLTLFLSEIAGNRMENASIYLRNYDTSPQRAFLRTNDGESLEITSILSPIKVKSPVLLDTSILSPYIPNKLTENSNGYWVESSMNTFHASNKDLSVSLVFSGEITYVDTDTVAGRADVEFNSSMLRIESSVRVSGTLSDTSKSDYPILVEGSLITGPESINIFGQTTLPGSLIEDPSLPNENTAQ